MNIFVQGVRRGFSLVEVVVAVGIFALAIVGVIGLLGPASRNVSDVLDSDAATRVVSAVQSEVQRMAQVTGGWTQMTTGSTRIIRTAAEVKTDDDNVSFDPSTTSYVIFASKTADKIGIYSSSTVWDPDGGLSTQEEDRDKFFEIVLIRNDALSNSANDQTSGYLAFTIRLRWPAYLPDGTRVTDNSQKNVMIVPAAINR